MVQHGLHHGNQPTVRDGKLTPLEQALGVDLHVVDGLLVACEPGTAPPLNMREHARHFLCWLLAQEKVAGAEKVPATLLETLLYPQFLVETGLQPKAWRSVSGALMSLGVRKRQEDGRDPAGNGRSPVCYRMPRRRA